LLWWFSVTVLQIMDVTLVTHVTPVTHVTLVTHINVMKSMVIICVIGGLLVTDFNKVQWVKGV
jgi:hypothetical protein